MSPHVGLSENQVPKFGRLIGWSWFSPKQFSDIAILGYTGYQPFSDTASCRRFNLRPPPDFNTQEHMGQWPITLKRIGCFQFPPLGTRIIQHFMLCHGKIPEKLCLISPIPGMCTGDVSAQRASLGKKQPKLRQINVDSAGEKSCASTACNPHEVELAKCCLPPWPVSLWPFFIEGCRQSWQENHL